MVNVVNYSLGYFSKDVAFGKPGDNAAPDVHGDVKISTDFPEFQLGSDHSVCSATNRLFKVGDIYVLVHLKKLAIHCGLMWTFVVNRSGTSLRYNRSTSHGSNNKKVILRTSSSIACGCGWCIRFNWVVPGKRKGIDKVKIIYVCGSQTNTCDPSNVDQLVLA